MTRRIQIAPSILAADFTRLGEQVRDAQSAGADRIHIDVMDGQFVPNITMGPFIVEAVRRVTDLPLDVHLMIVEPDQLLEAFAHAGASRIFVHWEACPNLHRTLGAIQHLGCEAGIAINPHTPALLLQEVLPMTSGVIVMTVNPGFGGQELIPETLPKIAAVRERYGARSADVIVDGGVNTETVQQVVDAGANLLVVGSMVFNRNYPVSEGISRLRAVLEK